MAHKVREVAINLKDVKTESWEVRLAAIHWLRDNVQTPLGRRAILKSLKRLSKPLQAQIKDLRSVIVREVCEMVNVFAQTLNDGLAIISPYLTRALLEITGGGNKIISQYCATTVFTLVRHTQSPKSTRVFAKLALSRSTKVRLNVLQCISILVQFWHPRAWLDSAEEVAGIVKIGIEDKFGKTRDTARTAYQFMHLHAPEVSENMKRKLGRRALARLKHGTVVGHGNNPHRRSLAGAGHILFRNATGNEE